VAARPPAAGHVPPPDPRAWVTAETLGRVVVLDLATGRTVRRIAVPGGPQYVAVTPGGTAVLTSPGAGTVTLLRPGRRRLVLRGVGGLFSAPDIVSVAPGGGRAYVTDGTRGRLTVIGLRDPARPVSVLVGAGAHHLAASPDGRRLWVALGEEARTIVILDTTDPSHPVLAGDLHPGFAAHDLAFSPDGRRVWITSASGPDVAVFRARDRRLLFRVPVGPPPQHVAFAGGDAYLTSGYGSVIERVRTSDGRIVARVRAPYGSFELDAGDGYVVTTSLLDGRVAIYTPALRLLRVLTVAPAARDVAITPR
jgi:DNA-binding beta-propeller fold protein YncE